MNEIKLLKPELVSIDKIKPYAKNAKNHPKSQIESLAANIRKHGFDQPVVVDANYEIIKGHGRTLAAKHLGLKRVPVIVRDDLSEDEVKAARLADNRTTSVDYDTELLQLELSELMKSNYEMDAIGFDDRELEFLTEQLDELENDALVLDVGDAFDEAKNASEADAEVERQKDVPIAQVFGFKFVPRSSEKAIREWVSRIEEATGEIGVDAIMKHIRDAA